MRNNPALFVFSLLILAGCTSQRNIPRMHDDGKLEVIFLQVNDVYEIAPVAGGREGGMARVASLKQEYQKKNPNTLLIMAGDFLSPSVYNSLRYNGKRIRGQQMVEAMNAAGMDIAMFGNHEFDISDTEFQSRLNESAFAWISSNVFGKTAAGVQPFRRTEGADLSAFPEYKILRLTDKDGTSARVGVFAITLPFNKAAYVEYTDPLETARQVYNRIKDSCDAIIAITHQVIAEDMRLAEQIPGLTVILGGHEHDMRHEKVGDVHITKAHANARSAFAVNVLINKNTRQNTVVPELRMIDSSIPLDSATTRVVNKWVSIAQQNYASLGFDATRIVIEKGDSLDGREAFIRSRATNLTETIMRAMAAACPEANVVIMNGGSIRVDDILYPPIYQYDILRSLPYGGSIREVEMKGSLLQKVLAIGLTNRGEGGYLHSFPTYLDSSLMVWKIRDEAIVPGKTYRVAMSDFLLTGLEQNLDFLNEKNPEIEKVYPVETSTVNPKSDLRLAIVKYLERNN